MIGPCGSCKARYGRSCCELPAGATPTFGMTLSEISRIAKSGYDPSFFVTAEKLTPEEWMDFVRKSDVFAQLFAGRIRFRLNVSPSSPGTSACVFLKKGEGCSLPVGVRPGSCRLYPFWFDRELVKGDGSDDISINSGLFVNNCYGHQLAKSGIPLLNMFNTSVDELTAIARRLVDDSYAHAKSIREDYESVKALFPIRDCE